MKRKRARNIHETEHIRLDTSKCEACWKCIEACRKRALGKVDIIIHKHALIRDAAACAGCGACAKACLNGAITMKKGKAIV